MPPNNEKECLACHGALPSTGFLSCTECENDYHVGKCSGVTAAFFKTKEESLQTTWKCPTCSTARLRGANGRKLSTDSDILVALASISAKLEALGPLSEKVDGIESSINMMSSKYDEVLEALKRQDEDIKKLNKRVDMLEEKDHSEEVAKLREDLNELEWRNRRLNLEIHGLPEKDDENLLNTVNEIAQQIKVPELTAESIGALHRLPAKQGKAPGIIVRFLRQKDRDYWLSQSKAVKNTKDSVFITENLTKGNRELLFKTKQWAKVYNYKFAWHHNGKILLRKAEGLSAQVIRSVDDLSELE